MNKLDMVRPLADFGYIETEEEKIPLSWYVAEKAKDESTQIHILCTAHFEKDEDSENMDYVQWVKEVFVPCVFNETETNLIQGIDKVDPYYYKEYFLLNKKQSDEMEYDRPAFCVNQSGPFSKKNRYYLLKKKDGTYMKTMVTELEDRIKDYYRKED